MSIVDRLRDGWAGVTGQAQASAPGARSADDDFWWTPLHGVSAGGDIMVTPETVEQLPTVRACLELLSGVAATLPLVIYRRESDGRKERFDRHPLFDLLNRQPNPLQSAYELRAQMMWDLAKHRNAFAEIRPGPRGPVDQLWRVDPLLVEMVKFGGEREHQYEISDPDSGRKRRVLAEDMLHIRKTPLTSDNLMGKSIIRGAWTTFARALALEDYSRRFFENDATPSGVIKTGKMNSPEEARQYRAMWMEQFTGAKRHQVAVLPNADEFIPITVPNDKAQFIETKKEMQREILRLWGIQPHKVGILDDATFSNVEQQGLEFVADTLMEWLVAWEAAITRDLILAPQRFFIEHDVSRLLRADQKTRFETYMIGRQGGWLSINEIRRMENLNPIDGGDEHLEPLNMKPVGTDAPAAIADRVVPQIAGLLEDRTAREGSTEAT